jgi:hypothetical protein
MIAEAMGIEFEPMAVKLVGKETLGKLMHSGTRILAEIGASALVSIIVNVQSTKVVQRLATELCESKSAFVATKAAVVLMIIVQYYPDEVLEKSHEVLPGFLKHCITNASPECRQVARKALLVW